MAFKMKAGKKGPMYKNFPSAFKDEKKSKGPQVGDSATGYRETPTVEYQAYLDRQKAMQEKYGGYHDAATKNFEGTKYITEKIDLSKPDPPKLTKKQIAEKSKASRKKGSK